jgi:hypothetical protein
MGTVHAREVATITEAMDAYLAALAGPEQVVRRVLLRRNIVIDAETA